MSSKVTIHQLPQDPRQLITLIAFVAIFVLLCVVALVTHGCHNNEVREVNVPITITLGK